MARRSDQGEPVGFLRRTLDRLATTTGAIEDAELREDAEAAGCAPISGCGDRQLATLHGTLRTVTLRPRGGVSALEAELYDGSGTATLIWLGQRRIAGISPGRQITVRGRVGMQGGTRVLYNPRYELCA
ncbi:MAG: OB-fold nucleic acid binding domain-containing protein [Nocardioidaceae bacterium]|nr:OB-fold nucleic acid binding domain-containing protein [Nocardioidaceae bacterium]